MKRDNLLLSLKPATGRRGAVLALALGVCLLALLRGGVAQERQLGKPVDPLEALRYPKTVFLVRHTEKVKSGEADPELSEEGLVRAQELARVLGDAGVTHLFSSEYKRTRNTLAPLALVSGAEVQVVTARDPKAQVSAIKNLPRDSVAVVSGHSNTVPALVKMLAPKSSPPELGEADYDRLFMVTLTGDDAPATMVVLRYGAPE